jgi:apolipoprotein N-acyltransferase
MSQRFTDGLSIWMAVAIGLAVSTGHPAGFIAATAMPLACLAPATRASAFRNVLGYYGAGLWPMIPGLNRYLQNSTSPLMPVLIWAASSILLAIPWTVVWMPDRRSHYLWRIPLATAAAIVPPLGLIGFISPVSGAGYLFPGTGWVGLVATVSLPAIWFALRDVSAVEFRLYLRLALTAIVVLALGSHASCPSDVEPPKNWEAVSTHFGDVSRPVQNYVAANSMQRHAAHSPAHVLIYPESVVPRWSEATSEFWRETLIRSRRRGQILAIGAGMPRNDRDPGSLDVLNFASEIKALQVSEQASSTPTAVVIGRESFDNVLLLLGSQSAAFYQRIPIPIGMWRPLEHDGVPLRLNGPGVIAIDQQRAAVLICYEQILTYPVLASMTQHPTILLGVSNSYWFSGTPIPSYQRSAMRAWAKLFHLPFLLAINS